MEAMPAGARALEHLLHHPALYDRLNDPAPAQRILAVPNPDHRRAPAGRLHAAGPSGAAEHSSAFANQQRPLPLK
jgi:hypothetical protein